MLRKQKGDYQMAVSKISEVRQYLTFKLEGEIFALDVGKVREILDYSNITKVPQTPEFMRGVINLRGSVVPVVDMRLKFNMPSQERTVDTCIIVVEINIDDEATILGALVDSVQEVFELEPAQIEPAPRIGTKLRTDFILGMGKREEQFVIILDIDKVFSSEELEMVHGLKEEAAA
jgi:purine-binding chemotaxis protein CheW